MKKKRQQKHKTSGSHQPAGSRKKRASGTLPSQRKKYIEQEFRAMAKVVAEGTDWEGAAYLTGPYAARRKTAILNYLDRAEKEFATLTLVSACETFSAQEVRAFHNYNQIESEHEIKIGAALWILEKLRASGRLSEAYQILPDTSGDPDAWYLPTDFSHPCYDNDLIQSVIHVIATRYGRINDDALTEENARGVQPSETWLSLLELLPQEDVERACEAFKVREWELVAGCMMGQAHYEEAIGRIADQIRTGISESMMPGPFAKPKTSGLTLPGLGGAMAGTPELWESNPDREKYELAREGQELVKRQRRFQSDFEAFLQMDHKTLRREIGREAADALAAFRVDDPYELCFALYYLLDTGDDAPWLLKSGSALMLYTVQMLPWFVDQEDWEDEDWDEWYEGIRYDYNGWLEREAPAEPLDLMHETHKGRTLAQMIYDLCRCVVPTGLHPFEAEREQLISEGMEEDKARRVIDIAELLFLQAFQAKQYHAESWLDGSPDEEEDIEDTAKPLTKEAVTIGGYWGKVAAAQGVQIAQSDETDSEPGAQDAQEELRKAREELSQLKRQFKGLQSALVTEKRSADAERAKYERELKTLRMEHRELADLRTLVFNQENEVREKPVENYSYPYETRKRTVVFGGHDTFLKAIKPMLPTVKYVDSSNLSFNPEIIRNADVVWIQNNCMSHSQFWSVVKHSKVSGVQLRYFGFASAEKCAEQLVTEDQK